jgi:DNA helicase-2/ATP-dependent DNA helicase PcrA
VLIPLIREGASDRQRLVGAVGEPFAQLAAQLAEWRQAMKSVRPARLLERVLDESGLAKHYSHDPERLINLERLVAILEERDNWALHPETALRSVLEFASLAKNMDLVSDSDRKVPAITVHQAKGLEFDTVFIAGAVENEMPSWFSRQEGTVEEERHLFYVALTRARERLFISGHARDERGYSRRESEFLEDLDLIH